ncbi:MAG: hypothetical protein DSZ21_00110 [Tenericutes bacterium]|nr:MAG: hypothetical protein DSZ21_00110 [Mycoplasmatota bacterium]
MIRNLFTFTDGKGNTLSGHSIIINRSLTTSGGTITITATDSDGNSEVITFNISVEVTTSDAESALKGIGIDSLITGKGSSASVKGDLSGLSTGDLAHFSISATISTAAVDGTSSTPDGTAGVITVTATPKDGFVLSGGESSLTTTVALPPTPFTRTYASENDLINAIKGFVDDPTNNIGVGQ